MAGVLAHLAALVIGLEPGVPATDWLAHRSNLAVARAMLPEAGRRTAGYLAHLFPHVYLDVGLAVNHTGAASERVIADSLELAPFTKVLFSSDAWGLPELHLLGSWLVRRGLSRILGRWVAHGDGTVADAARAIDLLAGGNARRVYTRWVSA